MSEPSTILVTGATGKLGTAVTRALVERGHRVRAVDRRYRAGFPLRIELGDLLDELFVYRVTEGCDTVVHLANHPHQFAGPSPQRLLSENVAIDANVFYAARDVGVGCVVFASSVQATIKRNAAMDPPPHHVPYLPLDGELPTNPGANSYALSKEIGERMLRLEAELRPELSATAVRFPMLVTDEFARRMRSARTIPAKWLDFTECTAHLFLPDAGSLVAAIIERRVPGYHQYFPALMNDLKNYPIPELVRDRYPHAELRRPLEELDTLIDISFITRELGWSPRERLSVEVDRSG